MAADLAKPRARRRGRARSSTPCSTSPGPPPRVDPWRRTSGMHRVRSRRERGAGPRAVAGPRRDRPGPRRLPRPGAARRRPVELATPAPPTSPADLADGPPAVDAALPAPVARRRHAGPSRSPRPTCRRMTLRADGPPPPRAWADRDPVAAARLAQARAEALAAFAAEHARCRSRTSCPRTPLRRVLWTPPEPADRGGRRGPARSSAPGPGRSTWRPRSSPRVIEAHPQPVAG